MDNPETLATLGTQDTEQINVWENWKGNQEWTIQRHWQHWATRHRTNKRSRILKGQSRMDNPETLATLGTQDTGQINVRENWRGSQEWTIQRHW